MAKQMGIFTTISGLSGVMVLNNLTVGETIEVAEGRNENGKVTDRVVYSKTTTWTGDGLLDCADIPPSAIAAGATISISGKTCLLETCNVTMVSTELAKVSFTATAKDNAAVTAYSLNGGTQ